MMTIKNKIGEKQMKEKCRVVKISYSEELPTESEQWFLRFIEKDLLEHIAKGDYKLQSFLINKKINL